MSDLMCSCGQEPHRLVCDLVLGVMQSPDVALVFRPDVPVNDAVLASYEAVSAPSRPGFLCAYIVGHPEYDHMLLRSREHGYVLEESEFSLVPDGAVVQGYKFVPET